jgi:hypothetical protein
LLLCASTAERLWRIDSIDRQVKALKGETNGAFGLGRSGAGQSSKAFQNIGDAKDGTAGL